MENVSPFSYASRVPSIFKGVTNALFVLEPGQVLCFGYHEEMYPALAENAGEGGTLRNLISLETFKLVLVFRHSTAGIKIDGSTGHFSGP